MITDAWGHVCSYLDPKTIVSLSAVDRKLRGVAKESLSSVMILVQTKNDQRAANQAWPRVKFVNTDQGYGRSLLFALDCVPQMKEDIIAHHRQGKTIAIPKDVCVLAKEEVERTTKHAETIKNEFNRIAEHAWVLWNRAPTPSVFDTDDDIQDQNDLWQEMLYNTEVRLEQYDNMLKQARVEARTSKRLAANLRILMKAFR